MLLVKEAEVAVWRDRAIVGLEKKVVPTYLPTILRYLLEMFSKSRESRYR